MSDFEKKRRRVHKDLKKAISTVEAGERVKMSVFITSAQHRRLKTIAFRKEQTISDIVASLVDSYIMGNQRYLQN